MPRVIDLAREMGMTGNLPAVPSAALGLRGHPVRDVGVHRRSPRAACVPQLHSLAAVLKPGGEAETGDDLPAPKRGEPAETAYQVTSMLQGVIDHGTAAASRSQGVDGPLARKTGTTSDRRDNSFAGYSPDRVTIVWVGYDDNAAIASFQGATRRCRSGAASPPPCARPRGMPTSGAAGDGEGHHRSHHRAAGDRALPVQGHRDVRRVAGADRDLPAPRRAARRSRPTSPSAASRRTPPPPRSRTTRSPTTASRWRRATATRPPRRPLSPPPPPRLKPACRSAPFPGPS